jgi:hypothetical protein
MSRGKRACEAGIKPVFPICTCYHASIDTVESIEALDERLLHATDLRAHSSSSSTRTRRAIFAQSKQAFYHTQLRRRCVHARHGHPVIHHHPRAHHRTATIHAAGHQRHLQETAQLILVLDRRLGVYEAAGIRQRHVGAREDVGGDGLAEDLDAERVGDDLFRLALEVGVDERDVVVAADDVAKRRQALFDALDRHGRGEGVSQVLKFLVRRGGGNEEAFAVATGPGERERVSGNVILDRVYAIVLSPGRWTYPAVNRPTILVPAIVAWHMGMTSCSSASKTE